MVEAKTMRHALEQMVSVFEGGGIDHALITTFNFDPGFFERNVLPLLCGLTLDDLKTRSQDALTRDMYYPLQKTRVVVAYDQGVLQGVSGGGLRYSILPQHQANGFFHAKLIVLAGKSSTGKPLATVMVGSGNMTLSGWAENIEVATWISVNRRNAEELLGFYEYLKAPEDLQAGIDILESIEGANSGPELFLQYSTQQNGLLFDRIFTPLAGNEIHLYSPYWSEEAVRRFATNTSDTRQSVRCYPTIGSKGYQFPVASEQLENSGIQLYAVKEEERFRHAKVYVWGTYVAVGSANCTLQALHTRNNVEAMLRFDRHPFPVPPSERLTKWITEPEEEEGIRPVPLEVLVVADYVKRSYQLSLTITSKSRCDSWSLRVGDIRRGGQGSLQEAIPFEMSKAVAQQFRVEWQGSDESGFLTGMIIPKGGNDVELGYRPKRNLERIFEDMLRHRPAGGGTLPAGSGPVDTDDFPDVEGDEPDGDDSPQEGEAFEFDMYGMYQSFFHMRKDFVASKTDKLKRNEIADTLLEILQAVKDKEVTNELQRWLIIQECMDMARDLPEYKGLKAFFGLKKELDSALEKVLNNDSVLTRYKIRPSEFLSWVRQELGHGA